MVMLLRRVPALVVAVVAAVMVILYGAIDPVAFADSGIQYYLPMAEAAPGLDLNQSQPYVYRVLGPWLAGVMPGMEEGAAFYLWAAVGSVALALLTLGFLRRIGIESAAAALAVLLFTMNPYLFGFNVFNHYQLGDLLTQLVVVGALWAVLDRRYVILSAVLTLGALAREPAILLPLIAALLLWQSGRLREEWSRLALASAPLVLLFIGMRVVIRPEAGLSLVQAFISSSPKALDPTTWYRLLINAFAPVVVLCAVFWRTAWSAMQRRLYLIILFGLVLVSAFFGTDQERLMQPAFLTVYVAAAAVIERHLLRPVPVALLLAAGVLTSLHHLTARYPLPSRPLTVVLSLMALAITLGLALAVRWRAKRHRVCAAP